MFEPITQYTPSLYTRSPLHEVDHVDDAWCTDHGLVGQDGPHCLLHTELRLQWGHKWLDLLTIKGMRKDRGGDMKAPILEKKPTVLFLTRDL